MVMGFRARALDSDDKELADNLAFRHLPLIGDGPVLMLYHQSMNGIIDWKADETDVEIPDIPGSFIPSLRGRTLRLHCGTFSRQPSALKLNRQTMRTFQTMHFDTVHCSLDYSLLSLVRLSVLASRSQRGLAAWFAPQLPGVTVTGRTTVTHCTSRKLLTVPVRVRLPACPVTLAHLLGLCNLIRMPLPSLISRRPVARAMFTMRIP